MDVHLVVVKGNPRGRTLTFGPGQYLFGRGQECHVRPDSEWVSRQHCLLCVTRDTISLKDLGSTNGTLVNGSRVMGTRDLAHGDTVQIGPLVLQVRVPVFEEQLEVLKETHPQASELTIENDPPAGAPPAAAPPTGAPPAEERLEQVDTVKLPSKSKSAPSSSSETATHVLGKTATHPVAPPSTHPSTHPSVHPSE